MVAPVLRLVITGSNALYPRARKSAQKRQTTLDFLCTCAAKNCREWVALTKYVIRPPTVRTSFLC